MYICNVSKSQSIFLQPYKKWFLKVKSESMNIPEFLILFWVSEVLHFFEEYSWLTLFYPILDNFFRIKVCWHSATCRFDVIAFHELTKGCFVEMSKSEKHPQKGQFANFHVVLPLYHLCI